MDTIPPFTITRAALPFPAIDPVAISLGPLSVHWYGLAYVAGILLAWWFVRKLVATPRLWAPHTAPVTRTDADDLVTWIVIGILLGGRLGYVLFYNAEFYLANPLSIPAIWDGGMSFHGGALGSIVAMVAFARSRGFQPFSLLDVVATGSCFGLLFGRIANFINAELWGRVSDVPWAIAFPTGGPLPRHPSQLYEAGLEGIVLFGVLCWLIYRHRKLATPGFVGGAWVFGYGCARIFVEFFRVPDAQLGYLAFGWLTMGMILSLPMLAIGAWSMATAARRIPYRKTPAADDPARS